MSSIAKDNSTFRTGPVMDNKLGDDASVRAEEPEQIRRDLGSRHINMIAIAGMIGTGLFLGSGKVLAIAGPAGALLAYTFMGFITLGVSYTTGEITTFMPRTGGFIRHATKFVEPALGAAVGWNFWYTMAIVVPTDMSAAATIIKFWNTSVHSAVWITIFSVIIIVLNFLNVKLYGESEVIFASLKIMLIVGLIIGGLVIDLGGGPNHEYIGGSYWRDPGAFNTYILDGSAGRFLAFWKVLLTAAFSFGNVQVVAISGSETRNPRKIIPSATKKTFLRVFIFYVLSILIVGLIVRFDDPSLTISTGNAAQSPFVIAFVRSGIQVVPSIINAVVCTSAISAGSSCIFFASRTLYGLSRDGHAPKILQRCNRFGTPHYAVGLTCCLMPLVYLNVGNDSSIVFGWLVNITTVSGLIGWVVIEVTYLRFHAGLKVQGYDRKELPYRSPGQPYTAWITLVCVVLILLTSGFDVFVEGNFTVADFMTCYLNLAIFAVLYIFFKIFLKSKVVPLDTMDLQTEFDDIRRAKEEEEAAEGYTEKTKMHKFVSRLRTWV